MRFISTIPFFYCSILFLKINGASSHRRQHRVFHTGGSARELWEGSSPRRGRWHDAHEKRGETNIYIILVYFSIDFLILVRVLTRESRRTFYGLSRLWNGFQTNRVRELRYESSFISYFHIIFYSSMIQNNETGQGLWEKARSSFDPSCLTRVRAHELLLLIQIKRKASNGPSFDWKAKIIQKLLMDQASIENPK